MIPEVFQEPGMTATIIYFGQNNSSFSIMDCMDDIAWRSMQKCDPISKRLPPGAELRNLMATS